MLLWYGTTGIPIPPAAVDAAVTALGIGDCDKLLILFTVGAAKLGFGVSPTTLV